MLPFADRYQWYKAGTAVVITFLKDNAPKDKGKQKASTPKGKGKQREKDVKSELTVVDMEALANKIVGSTDPEIKIPPNILMCLQDVIDARKEAGRMFERRLGWNSESNITHRYFVNVLERIRDKFRAASTRSGAEKAQQGTTEAQKSETLANIFEHLTLEEPRKWDSSKSSTPRPGPAKEPAPVEPGADDESEAMFVIWCFFKDMMDIRNYLYEVWDEYYHGNLSLMIAAETTNIAFTLILNAQMKMHERYPKFSSQKHIYDFLGLNVISSDPRFTFVSVDSGAGKEPEDKDLEAAFQMQSLFCMHAYRICRDFTILTPRAKNATREARESILSNAETMHPFASLLYALLPDIKILATQKTGLELDTFTTWLTTLYNTGQILPCVVVGVQVYMSIFDLLGEKNYNFCFQHLRLRSEEAKRVLDARISLGRGLTVIHDQAQPLFLNEKQRITTFISNDGIAELRKKANPSIVVEADERHRLFRYLPVLCGHLIFETQILQHINGIQWSVNDFNVLAAAYLYQTARQAGLQTPWEDMDFVVQTHRRPHAFIFDETASPTPLKSMARHYCLALGMTAKQMKFSGALETWKHMVVPVLPNEGKLRQKTRQLEVELPFLAEMMKENERGAVGGWMSMTEAALHRVALQLEAKENPTSSAGKRPRTSAAHMQKSIVDLLHALRSSLVYNETDMNFRYLDFWTMCKELLGKATEVTRAELATTSRMTIDVHKDYEILNYIFWEAAHAEQDSSPLQIRETRLAELVPLMDEELTKFGPDKFYSAAQKACGGSMPEGWKPVVRNQRPADVSYGHAALIPPGLMAVSNPLLETKRIAQRYDARTKTLLSRHLEESGEVLGFAHQYMGAGVAAAAAAAAGDGA